MASYTTNYSTWSDLESVVAAAQAYQSSAAYTTLKNSLANLQALVTAGPVSSSGTSTSATLYYAGGAVAYAYGHDFGTPSAVITRLDITDNVSTISMIGAVSA